MTERIPDPAISELKVSGELVYRLEQRQVEDMSELETAAACIALGNLVDHMKSKNLDRPIDDVLAESDYHFDLDDMDDPSNVE